MPAISSDWQVSVPAEVLFVAEVNRQWDLCEYVIVNTILPPSPVILWTHLGAKMASIETWIPWRKLLKSHYFLLKEYLKDYLFTNEMQMRQKSEKS